MLAQRAGLGAGIQLTLIVITGKEEAMTEAELAIVRRAYAKQMLAVFGVTDPRVEAAFAPVRREAYLGPAVADLVPVPARLRGDAER